MIDVYNYSIISAYKLKSNNPFVHLKEPGADSKCYERVRTIAYCLLPDYLLLLTMFYDMVFYFITKNVLAVYTFT